MAENVSVPGGCGAWLAVECFEVHVCKAGPLQDVGTLAPTKACAV